jgi:trehalose/maltose hydrolase-like predicted phosphorylase
MGGLWQALVFGFAGVRARNGILAVDPHLPPDWGAIELRLRFRGHPLGLRVDREGVALDAASDLRLDHRDHLWEVHPT